jgi:hypothetical protein
MKRIAALILTAIILVSMTTTAFATDPPVVYSTVPTSGVPATSGIGSAQGSLFGNKITAMTDSEGISIYVWRNSIEEISSGYLKCYCYTMTDLNADRVENDYVLHQWNGSSWVTYSTSANWMLGTDLFITNIYRFVAHGYYYRIVTTHCGWWNTYYDERTLTSSYIYVS